MKYIGSLIWGGMLGAAAVMLNNAFDPFGLILAAIGGGIGIWIIGKAWGFRRYKVIAALAWLLVVWRAIVWGVGGEHLVQLDNTGLVFLFAGWISLLVAVSITQ